LNEESDLKKAGLKVTLPRLRILELLEDKKEMHLSAEDIYKKLLEAGEDVGLATVYRVLTQFEQAGIVVKNNFEEGRAVYELHHDQHHDHMVCVETGKIIEFHDEIIEQRQSDVAKDLGYVIVDHSMVLYVKTIKK
jgi:Fur family ferric uptake transcriptional regulator|tara:strand:- start:1575 stop:1982 length:408 start_codon:yes stop_codon:yes gene_type:complete